MMNARFLSVSLPAGPRLVQRVTLRAVSESSVVDYSGASDGELARAISNDAGTAAETELVRRFGRRVFLYGMRHLGDEAQADDLAQDVMTLVLRRLRAGEVTEPDRIGSFVLGTARWTVRDVRRRQRRAAEVADAAALESEQVARAPELLDLDRLAEAMAGLPERERAVVVLTFQQDHSAQEIADAFGLTPGNVRVIRHRAIARLAALMGVVPAGDGTELS